MPNQNQNQKSSRPTGRPLKYDNVSNGNKKPVWTLLKQGFHLEQKCTLFSWKWPILTPPNPKKNNLFLRFVGHSYLQWYISAPPPPSEVGPTQTLANLFLKPKHISKTQVFKFKCLSGHVLMHTDIQVNINSAPGPFIQTVLIQVIFTNINILRTSY